MKRLLCLLAALVVTLTACGDPAPAATVPTTTTLPPSADTDIVIEDIPWELTTEKDGKDTYLAITYTNNSEYTLSSFKLKFKEKEGLTKEQRDAYWAALEKSQGEDAVETLREMRAMQEMEGGPGLILYAKDTKAVKPGQSGGARCLVNDQLESRNVVFPELYTPYIADIEYKDGDETVLIHYNFITKTYSVR